MHAAVRDGKSDHCKFHQQTAIKKNNPKKNLSRSVGSRNSGLILLKKRVGKQKVLQALWSSSSRQKVTIIDNIHPWGSSMQLPEQ